MKPTPRYAWVILAVVYFASIVAPFNQFKVPPVLAILIAEYGITLAQAGLLMSTIALVGLILALPAGVLLQRFGPKPVGVIALVCLALGSLAGALAPSFALLLASRLLEGLGVGLISVVAPAMIAMWFPAERQGTPMGIWATWVPVGTVVMYALAPAMAQALGWQSVWLLGAAYAGVMLVIYAALIRVPETPPATPAAPLALPRQPSVLDALANRDIWLLALAFALYNLVFVAQGSYYPTFLNKVREVSLSNAALIASLGTMVTLVSAPLGGWVSDRINSRRLAFSIPFLILAPFFVLPYLVTGVWIPVVMILSGVFGGIVPTATFAAAPELMRKPEMAGLGLAAILVGQNLGQLVGPLLYGAAIPAWGWTAAGALMVPFCLAGFVAGWLVRIR